MVSGHGRLAGESQIVLPLPPSTGLQGVLHLTPIVLCGFSRLNSSPHDYTAGPSQPEPSPWSLHRVKALAHHHIPVFSSLWNCRSAPAVHPPLCSSLWTQGLLATSLLTHTSSVLALSSAPHAAPLLPQGFTSPVSLELSSSDGYLPHADSTLLSVTCPCKFSVQDKTSSPCSSLSGTGTANIISLHPFHKKVIPHDQFSFPRPLL